MISVLQTQIEKCLQIEAPWSYMLHTIFLATAKILNINSYVYTYSKSCKTSDNLTHSVIVFVLYVVYVIFLIYIFFRTPAVNTKLHKFLAFIDIVYPVFYFLH